MQKNNFSFILTLISIAGCLALAWFKNVNIEAMLPTILATYVLGRAGLKASNVWAASKDSNASTLEAIDKCN